MHSHDPSRKASRVATWVIPMTFGDCGRQRAPLPRIARCSTSGGRLSHGFWRRVGFGCTGSAMAAGTVTPQRRLQFSTGHGVLSSRRRISVAWRRAAAAEARVPIAGTDRPASAGDLPVMGEPCGGTQGGFASDAHGDRTPAHPRVGVRRRRRAVAWGLPTTPASAARVAEWPGGRSCPKHRCYSPLGMGSYRHGAALSGLGVIGGTFG